MRPQESAARKTAHRGWKPDKERRIQGCAFSEPLERLGLFPKPDLGRPGLLDNRPCQRSAR